MECAKAYSFSFIVTEIFLGFAFSIFINVTDKTPLSTFLLTPTQRKEKKKGDKNKDCSRGRYLI